MYKNLKTVPIFIFTLLFVLFFSLYIVKSIRASVPASNWIWTTTVSNTAYGVTTDTSGNVYVAIGYSTLATNNKIAKYTTSGSFISEKAAYGTGNAQFKQPHDVAVDSAGNIYVADYGNHRIQKLDSTYAWVWTVGGTAYASTDGKFYYPEGIAVNSSTGLVYVADTRNNRIQIFDSTTGAFVDKFGSLGTGSGQFNSPKGLAIDTSGNIYVADYGNNRIQIFNSSKEFIGQYGSTMGSSIGQFKNPSGVSVDSSGNIYVADYGNNRVQKITSGGTFVSPFGSTGTANGQFNIITDVTVDSSGNIFTVELTNKRIQKFDYTGTAYQVSNISPLLDITIASNGFNIEDTGAVGVNSASIELRIKEDDNLTLTDVTVDMSADRDWSLLSGDSDRVAGKSYINNLIGSPGVASTHALYVPVPLGRVSDSVYICPNATSLANVTTSCVDGVSRAVGTYTESFGNIEVSQVNNLGDNITYWKITGMTGSGGISELLEYSGSGSGTVEDPYLITSCLQLQDIKNVLYAHYELSSNIDCTESSTWNAGNGFLPIGISIDPFTGTLEGNNYSVSNLYIHAPISGDNYGMFAFTNSATISNLNLVNYDITGNNYVGGLIANMIGGSVTNVDVSGDLGATEYGDAVETGDSVGGLVGVSSASATISNCTSNVALHSSRTYSTGGLVGKAGDGTLIEDSSSTGNVLIDVYAYGVGSFVGFLDGSSVINDSYSTGSVTVGGRSDNNYSSSYYIGGFVGETINSTINRSHSNSAVNATGIWYEAVGGFIGYSRDTNVTDSYSTGNIEGNEAVMSVGGFVGNQYKSGTTGVSLYERCHSTGNVYIYGGDEASVGGFVGLSSGDIEDSYSAGDVTAAVTIAIPYANDVGGFLGKSYNSSTQSQYILRSFSLGDVITATVEESYTAGGFIGSIGENITIDQCASYGASVNTNMYVGGFIGSTYGDNIIPSEISNSFSRTNTRASDAYNYGYVGGFVGNNRYTTITNTYSTGTSTSDYAATYLGGFTGRHNTGSIVNSSYWDKETSGVETDAIATGYTTVQMKTQANFTDWDFDTIWDIDGTTNDGYPYLSFSSTKLSSLEFSAGTISPSFNSSIKTYTITVPTDTTAISLKPTLENGLGSTSINGAPAISGQWSGEIALPSSSNIFLIENLSYDTLNTSTYTITVLKDGESSPEPEPEATPVSITDLDSSLSVIDVLSGLDATIPSTVFKGTNRIIQLYYGSGSDRKIIAQTIVDLTTSRSWANVIGAVDLQGKKSFVSSLSTAPGGSSIFTLFVPRISSDSLVRVCDGAESLKSVYTFCANGRTLSYRSTGVIRMSFGTQLYWAISNVTGTGGISYVAPYNILPVILPEDEPIVTPTKDPADTPDEEEKPIIPKEDEQIPSSEDSFFKRVIVIPIGNAFNNLFASIKAANIDSTITRTVLIASFSSLFVTYFFNSFPVRLEYSLYKTQLLSSFFGFGNLAKRNQPYGIVYDSVTKEPINMAVIRVSDLAGRLIKTIVSDIYGIFDLTLPTGNYKFDTRANSYIFPSEILHSTEDLPYKNLYFGTVINHTSNKLLNLSIPLDKEDTELLKESWTSIKSILASIIRILSFLFFLFGLITTVYALRNNPTTWTWIVFGLYILILGIYIFMSIGVRRNWGYVKNTNRETVSGIEIGLIEKEFGTLYAKRVTDDKGRYRFIVPSGKYELVLLTTGLSLVDFDKEIIEVKKDRVKVIKKNLTLSRV